MILMIDNYDSFTYNLVQSLGQLGLEVVVARNDSLSLDDIQQLDPSHIVISPGPGLPVNAGITLSVIRRFASVVPVLGVCLGHQAIGEAFGAVVVHAPRPMHGKVSPVFHDGTGLHRNLPNPFSATRYHSLVLDPASIPSDLVVNAWTENAEVMAIRHCRYPVFGVQYHPESIMTGVGQQVVRAFIDGTTGSGAHAKAAGSVSTFDSDKGQ